MVLFIRFLASVIVWIIVAAVVISSMGKTTGLGGRGWGDESAVVF
jgi:hypothetical protein